MRRMALITTCFSDVFWPHCSGIRVNAILTSMAARSLVNQPYSYAFFAPGIIRSYGYSQIGTQLHSVPPWACAFVFAMIIATFSDFTKHRFAFTMIPICIAITGFGILLTVHNRPNLEYAALFLVAMGCYSAMPVIVCWFNMNLGGHHRRSVGTAWQV